MKRKCALGEWKYGCGGSPEISRVCMNSSIIVASTTKINNKQSYFLES